MKIAQIYRAIVPKKIKNVEELTDLVQDYHHRRTLFGITMNPKYKLTQDVLENFTDQKLYIPSNLFVIFKGKGNPKIKLGIADNTTFRAKHATFGATDTSGKKLVLKEVEGDLHSYKSAKTSVGTVWGDAISAGKSVQSNDSVKGNAVSRDLSRQYNNEVFGVAKSEHSSVQNNFIAHKNALSAGKSTQFNFNVKGDAISAGNSTQINSTIEQDAISTHHSIQRTASVLGDAIIEGNSTQFNQNVVGKTKLLTNKATSGV